MSETKLSRRGFLTSNNKSQNNARSAAILSDNLEAYDGDWNFTTANHLIRRTTFGATFQQVQEIAESSLQEAIDNLFVSEPIPKGPINYYFEQDFVPLGEEWVDQPIDRSIGGFRASRQNSLEAWNVNTLYEASLSIREKMVLFWQNHFAIKISVTRDPNFIYKYSSLLRELATGNFKTLIQRISVEPAMLHYLNGHDNRNGAPNENYARELFELYTVGKGQLAGPGDYTTFTEDDVIEAAKVLTGWLYVGQFGSNGNPASSLFRPNQHDNSDKQFSHRFNNTSFVGNSESEYLDLIDMIFDQEAVSKHMCRKLYRWFVHFNITDDIEINIIEPLAEIMRNSNYEIEPVLRTLLSSCHFFNECNRGSMIKNPLDFYMNLIKQHELNVPEHGIINPNNERLARMDLFARLDSLFSANDMSYFEPPSVAGWKAYYQEPLYYRSWINSVTLNSRQSITNLFVRSVRLGGFTVGLDFITYVSKLPNPFILDDLIADIVMHLFPNPLSENQLNGMKLILENWNNEYGEFVAEPDGTDRKEELRAGVESKLDTFFNTLFHMPEYYLS